MGKKWKKRFIGNFTLLKLCLSSKIAYMLLGIYAF